MAPSLVERPVTEAIRPSKPIPEPIPEPLPPGRYFVGDLWYVMRASTWDNEILRMVREGRQSIRNIYRLKDGRRFSLFRTPGNGCYKDDKGKTYPIESSTIGCVHVDDADEVFGRYVSKRTPEYWKRLNKFGRVVDIRAPIYPYHSGYSTVFGPVEVFLDNVNESDTEYDSDE